MENPFKNKPIQDTNVSDDSENGEEKKKRPVVRSATDLQRLKLEKLMKNPDKPVVIPEQPRERDYLASVPSFVRNVMGSSAGAGSGEFHVYRHLRRKEYARQKCIQAKSLKEQMDEEYRAKLEKNRLEAEAKTAKKRAKRLKKKQRAKKVKTKPNGEKSDEKNPTSDEDNNTDESPESEMATSGTAPDDTNRQEHKSDAAENETEEPTNETVQPEQNTATEGKDPSEDGSPGEQEDNSSEKVESKEADQNPDELKEATDSNTAEEPNEEGNK